MRPAKDYGCDFQETLSGYLAQLDAHVSRGHQHYAMQAGTRFGAAVGPSTWQIGCFGYASRDLACFGLLSNY